MEAISRTYDQYCPVARALEVIGERWTMLIVRELMLGPRRFTDLREGLSAISANLLVERLNALQDAGIVHKRRLPPPAASTVFELAPDPGLARVLAAMANWGLSLLGRPRAADEVRGRWLVLGLAVSTAMPGVDDETFELHVDDEVLALRVQNGGIIPTQGAAPAPDAIITLSSETLVEVASGGFDFDRPQARKRIAIDGDKARARRLLVSFAARGTWPSSPMRSV